MFPASFLRIRRVIAFLRVEAGATSA